MPEALRLSLLAGALGRPACEPPTSGPVGIPGLVGMGSLGEIAVDAPIKNDWRAGAPSGASLVNAERVATGDAARPARP